MNLVAKLLAHARLVTAAPSLSLMPSGRLFSGANATVEFASSVIAFRRIATEDSGGDERLMGTPISEAFLAQGLGQPCRTSFFSWSCIGETMCDRHHSVRANSDVIVDHRSAPHVPVDFLPP
jgi:hypothetical protein